VDEILESSIEKTLNWIAMAQATERLRRYLEDELGECRSEDVDTRLGELRTLETTLEAWVRLSGKIRSQLPRLFATLLR
jgi:hypothetical protein